LIDPKIADFRNFVWICWKHLNLPQPTPVQYDIASFVDSDIRRLCVQAFRGVGKSWITSAYVCHQLLLDPNKNILVVSASKTRADDFSTFTLRLIHEVPILQHLRPREGQRQSKISFDVGPAKASHAPSVKSLGITGQLTGSRADLVVADDVESANNSQTQLMRDKLSETIKEFDAIIKPGGRILFLGTPQTEMSIYSALEERGYTTRIWPARYPSERLLGAYGGRLAPLVYEGTEDNPENAPVDPLRFSSSDLEEREASYGRSGFALQFMLDTTLSDADKYPLKLNDLIVMSGPSSWDESPVSVKWASGVDQMEGTRQLPAVGLKGDYWVNAMQVSEEWDEWNGSVMSIDPSGRGKDETAYAVVKMQSGFLYLTEMGGLDNGYSEEALETLANVAAMQDVNEIIVESNFGDGMFTQLFRPVLQKIHPCSIEEVRHSTQKEKRIIDTLEPVMNQHRLIVDEDVILEDFRSPDLKKQLFYQMTRLTKDRGSLAFDDRIDALSIAVNYWVEVMDRDAQSALEDFREEQLEIELEQFMDAVDRLNRPVGSKHNWNLRP
tara:strand:+ start:1013 stop:2677 length:1665 start_codon:yes stop_codon:yes gene_type:complete